MSEPHAEPPAADVRSFLPRPGEPVDDYAARLRALHHDLTLVLEAVERGLAAAAEAEAEAEAAPAPAAEVRPLRTSRPLEVATEPSRPLPPVPAGPRGSARVEIVSTPATATSGPADSGGAWSGPPEPEGSAPWGGRRAPVGEGAPAWGEPAASSPERSPRVEAVPSTLERRAPWEEAPQAAERRGVWEETAERRAPWEPYAASSPQREEAPPWTQRRPSAWPPPPPPPAEMSFEPPPHAPFAAPPRRRMPSLPPLVLAATLLGWLIALALGLALALGS